MTSTDEEIEKEIKTRLETLEEKREKLLHERAGLLDQEYARNGTRRQRVSKQIDTNAEQIANIQEETQKLRQFLSTSSALKHATQAHGQELTTEQARKIAERAAKSSKAKPRRHR